MKVGILTYHFSDNFGALMQAYGLRQWLREQGVAAEFINYHPAHVEQGVSGLGRSPKAIAKSLFLKASHIKRRLFGNDTQTAAFREFRVNDLGVAGAELPQASAMGQLAAFDLIVCGSDQIWNPSDQFGLDPVYFADFPGASRARRISYAASFGKATLAAAYQDQAATLIAALDAVSVRERSGVDIVHGLTGKAAVLVPDPTVLVGDFSSLIAKNPSPSKGHVFCYTLRSPHGVREAAAIAAQRFSAPILSPDNPHRRWREIGKTVFPSPGEWISMIDSAAFVVTNSFHGVALSLVLQKPFVSIALPGGRADLNERARNLLAQVGLDDRLVLSDVDAKVRHLMDVEIDWPDVKRKLDEASGHGRAYLAEQIALAKNASAGAMPVAAS